MDQDTTKRLFENICSVRGAVFNVVAKDVEELVGVLLLPHIDSLAVPLEHVNESLRLIKLFL